MPILSPSGTTLVLLVLGLTILIGFGSDWLAHRFRLPDVLWLIALGVVVGPLLQLVRPSQLLFVAPVLGAAALILILFDAGLDMRAETLQPLATSALWFAGLSYGGSTAVLFLAGHYLLFPHDLGLSLLFAAALGCTSGAVVIPLASRLGLSGRLRRLVSLESALEDTFAIVAVSVIVILVGPTGSTLRLALSVALPFPVGVAVGFVAGIAWLEFLSSWQHRPYAALATLGFLFLVYGVTQALGGSGILAALVLGIVLANEPLLHRLLRRTQPFTLAPGLRQVEGEIAYLLRSFFLLLLGVLTVGLPPATTAVVIGALTVLLFLARRGFAIGVTRGERPTEGALDTMAGLYGRGLTSAVLITVSLSAMPAAGLLLTPSLLLIVGTNIVMTVLLFSVNRARRLAEQPPPSEEPVEFMALAPDPHPNDARITGAFVPPPPPLTDPGAHAAEDAEPSGDAPVGVPAPLPPSGRTGPERETDQPD